MNLISVLAGDNFIVVNRDLIKLLGLKSAVLFAELCSEQNLWSKAGNTDECVWFYSTQDKVEEKTGLSPYEQREALKELVSRNLVETKKQGIPCKTYYRICLEQVVKIFNNKDSKISTSTCENSEPLNISNEIEVTENNKEKETVSKDTGKKTTFSKPTVDEVRAYCNERGNNINAEQFVDYYQSKGWLVGKAPMKDWKACVRTWERNGYGSKTAEPTERKKVAHDGGYSDGIVRDENGNIIF